jgi:hypothetical protein
VSTPWIDPSDSITARVTGASPSASVAFVPPTLRPMTSSKNRIECRYLSPAAHASNTATSQSP